MWIMKTAQGKMENTPENNRRKQIVNDSGIRAQFPKLWKQFLLASKMNDQIT